MKIEASTALVSSSSMTRQRRIDTTLYSEHLCDGQTGSCCTALPVKVCTHLAELAQYGDNANISNDTSGSGRSLSTLKVSCSSRQEVMKR